MRSIEDELRAKKAENKPRLSLVPTPAITGIAHVMEFGAKKHGLHDWRKGFLWTERIDSALRHVIVFKDGEDNDQQSGLCHLDHAMTQLSMIRDYMTTHPELDDRHKAGD